MLTPAQLRELVRRAFRAPPPASGSREQQLDRAFLSLRLLAEQVALHEASSSCTTEGVHVEVRRAAACVRCALFAGAGAAGTTSTAQARPPAMPAPGPACPWLATSATAPMPSAPFVHTLQVTTAHMGSQAELDPMYDEEEDGPSKKEYFTYRIRVSNLGWGSLLLATGGLACCCTWPACCARRCCLKFARRCCLRFYTLVLPAPLCMRAWHSGTCCCGMHRACCTWPATRALCGQN